MGILVKIFMAMHPGNLRVLPDNVLVFLDFGLVGQLDNDNMTQLTRIFLGCRSRGFQRLMLTILQQTLQRYYIGC